MQNIKRKNGCREEKGHALNALTIPIDFEMLPYYPRNIFGLSSIYKQLFQRSIILVNFSRYEDKATVAELKKIYQAVTTPRTTTEHFRAKINEKVPPDLTDIS